jgi:hypothetical protein
MIINNHHQPSTHQQPSTTSDSSTTIAMALCPSNAEASGAVPQLQQAL